MFIAKPQQQQATATMEDTVIASPPGFAIFYFAPATQKPSLQVLGELQAAATFPVICFGVRGGMVTPLTLFTPDAVIERFLFTPGRIFALDDDKHQSWSDKEQWQQHVLRVWQDLRPKEPPPKPRELQPVDPVAVISNRGYF